MSETCHFVLESSHEPHAWLFHIGEVVVFVVGQVVGLHVECIAGMGPLQFDVERPVGAEGLLFPCLGIVEASRAVLEGEVPLRRESADDAMMERGDQLMSQEGHARGVVGVGFRVDAVFIVVAVAEGETLE